MRDNFQSVRVDREEPEKTFLKQSSVKEGQHGYTSMLIIIAKEGVTNDLFIFKTLTYPLYLLHLLSSRVKGIIPVPIVLKTFKCCIFTLFCLK